MICDRMSADAAAVLATAILDECHRVEVDAREALAVARRAELEVTCDLLATEESGHDESVAALARIATTLHAGTSARAAALVEARANRRGAEQTIAHLVLASGLAAAGRSYRVFMDQLVRCELMERR